ncbi:phage tail tape measure protein [Paraclostridium sordellii]|uniref:phage tail tape measure protein n=1 Tax=Paraclostridium sordellii TaxID=1505 RepID=UPI0005DB6BA2|nr:phage tail tape measure protein [Paeniclostridium sordellii]CEN86372.1 phage tail tape measure protein [[Clostridium] sordellii] [Paeniclostridium sordellii]
MAANIKIRANSSDFQKQMKEMSAELKKVGSSYSLAQTQARLFGSTTDVLKSKQSELTSKMQIQNRMIEAQTRNISKLNSDISKQKEKQSTLADKIEKTNEKYKESVSQTGKNSEESKKLKQELDNLKKEYEQNDRAIDSNTKKLDNAEIKLNNSKKALLENEKALQEVNKELEKSKLDKFSEGLEKSSQKAEGISNKMKPASTAITGIGTAAAMASIGFEDGMAKVSTIADTTQVPLGDLRKGILDLSDQTGISSEEIANNVYDAISAGQQTGDAVNFVSNSTKLAKAGFAEAGQSLDLLTTIMNSYGLKAQDVTKVSDTLIQTQNLGKVTVGQLSADMGKVIPTAKSLGVNLEQVASGYAIMTSKGIKSAETTTYMNSMLNELGKSGTAANKALKKASGKSFPELIKSGKSLGDILAMMEKDAKKSGKSLSDMFGSAEAGKAALVLSSKSGKEFNDMLGKMKDSAGSTETAFNKVNSATSQGLRKALNSAKNALIGFGDVISPFISLVAKGIANITKAISGMSGTQKKLVVGLGAAFVATNLAIGGFAKLSKGLSNNIKFMQKSGKAIKDYAKATRDGETKLVKFGKGIVKVSRNIKDFTINIGKKAVQGLKSFGKGLLTVTKNLGKLTLVILKNSAQLTKNGLMWAGNKAKMLAFKGAQLAVTTATKAMTLAQKGLNLVMSMNPIGIVITALVALGAVFVTLYNKCEWFRNGVNAVWNGVKNIFIGFANFFKGAFHQDFTRTFGLLGVPLNHFFSVVGTVWNGIKGVFNGVLTFLSGVFTGNWRKIFSGLKQIISSIFGTIGGIIKAPINAAISGINSAIRAVNRISFTVPNWVPMFGGKHFGIHLPQIPALAEGGIVTKSTLALVGEGKEHEAVIPLSKLDKLVTNSVQKVLDNRGNKTYEKDSKEPKIIQINLQVGSKNVAEAIFDEFGNLISKNQRSRGIARGHV